MIRQSIESLNVDLAMKKAARKEAAQRIYDVVLHKTTELEIHCFTGRIMMLNNEIFKIEKELLRRSENDGGDDE